MLAQLAAVKSIELRHKLTDISAAAVSLVGVTGVWRSLDLSEYSEWATAGNMKSTVSSSGTSMSLFKYDLCPYDDVPVPVPVPVRAPADITVDRGPGPRMSNTLGMVLSRLAGSAAGVGVDADWDRGWDCDAEGLQRPLLVLGRPSRGESAPPSIPTCRSGCPEWTCTRL